MQEASFFSPYLERRRGSWQMALGGQWPNGVTPIQFEHAHGPLGMLTVQEWRGVDCYPRTQAAKAETFVGGIQTLPKRHNLLQLADEGGYIASLDTFTSYVDAETRDLQEQPTLSPQDLLDLPTKRQSKPSEGTPKSSYTGSDPSPLATHLVFRWCDGVRSNLVEALFRNQRFQQSGRHRLIITHSSAELKDQILGPNIWNSCWTVWQKNWQVLREYIMSQSDSTMDPGQYVWKYLVPPCKAQSIPFGHDDPSLTSGPDDLERLPENYWHYKTPEEIDVAKNTWYDRRIHKGARDRAGLHLFRRYVELHPGSEEAKGWRLASHSGTKMWNRVRKQGSSVRGQALDRALRLKKILKTERAERKKERRR